MLRIIHVCYSFKWGGISSLVKTIIELNKNGSSTHDLLLVNTDIDDTSIINICSVYSLEYIRNGFIIAALNAYHILRRYNGALIHAPHPVVIFPLLLLQKNTALFQHGMTVTQGRFLKRLLKKIWYSTVPLMLWARIICSTPFAKEKLRKKGIYLPAFLLRIIPFGVKCPSKSYSKRAGSEKERLRIGLAGHFLRAKRFHRVLKSFLNYQGQMKYEIKIAGEGPEEVVLKNLAAQVMSESVEISFLGRIHDMKSFYSDLDLFILPGKEESFGLVVVEALFHGVPVAVFSDVGGALSLVENGRNGFILQDVNDLKHLWYSLSENPEVLYKQRKYIEELDLSDYSIANTRKQLEDVLMEGL